MPVLKNPRHELYAQALAQGKTASEAIGLAGYSPDPRNTTPLTKNPDIRRRVDELLNLQAARQQKKADYDSRWVTGELMENALMAKAEGDYAASNAALKLLGMEKHMFRERVEQGHVGEFDDSMAISDIIATVRDQVGEQAALALINAFGLTKTTDNTADNDKLAAAPAGSDSVN